jgi:HEPN domain-containing protein
MKPETVEWSDKAEGDWKVAQRERQAADPVWNVVCFLAQQCAEKYLKAFLEEQNIMFHKTHDLVALLNLSAGLLLELDPQRPALLHLSTFGIATRYPGVQADQQAAENTIKVAAEVRTVVRAKLSLP